MFKPSLLASFIGLGFAANSYAINPQTDPLNAAGYVVADTSISADEAAKTPDPMYDVWAKALETRPNSVVEAIVPGAASNPENVKRVERVFPQAQWDFLTQMAAPEYTYTRFLRAIGKFPAFCGNYEGTRDADAICKKSIVTAFAHFSQETGGHISIDNSSDNPKRLEEWQQALVHVREMGWSEGQEGYTTGCGQNDWQNARWPCEPGQGYFGRGAKQLSYHFNYGAFSEVMFDGDASVLLKNPGLVADSWLNLASAIWFFLTPQAPKPAMLHVIDRTWVPSQRETDAGIGYGFGTTINVINGGIECGEHNKTKGQPVNRIRYWEGLAAHYQIPIEADELNTCYQQTPYGNINLNGATDVLYTNWDGNWKYYSDRPEGQSFECDLVGFQTAYSALEAGGYEKCVTNLYGSHANWPKIRVIAEADMPTDPNGGGEPGSGGVNGWSADKVYDQAGEQVVYQGNIYESLWWTKGDLPDAAGPWKFVKVADTTEPPVPTDPVDPPVPTDPVDPTVPGTDFVTWEAGVTVAVKGDKVTHAGKCFIAQNNPGKWETPTTTNWFWQEVACQ